MLIFKTFDRMIGLFLRQLVLLIHLLERVGALIFTLQLAEFLVYFNAEIVVHPAVKQRAQHSVHQLQRGEYCQRPINHRLLLLRVYDKISDYIKQRKRQAAHNEREAQRREQFAILLMRPLLLYELLAQHFVVGHAVVLHFEESYDPNVSDEHAETGQHKLKAKQYQYVDAFMRRIRPALHAVVVCGAQIFRVKVKVVADLCRLILVMALNEQH